MGHKGQQIAQHLRIFHISHRHLITFFGSPNIRGGCGGEAAAHTETTAAGLFLERQHFNILIWQTGFLFLF